MDGTSRMVRVEVCKKEDMLLGCKWGNRIDEIVLRSFIDLIG